MHFDFPWWLWAALLVLIGAVLFAFARGATARAAGRAKAERMAQQADAAHEGAVTRHEGGA